MQSVHLGIDFAVHKFVNFQVAPFKCVTIELRILTTDPQYSRFLAVIVRRSAMSAKTLLHFGKEMKIGRRQVGATLRVTHGGETKGRRIPPLVVVPVYRLALSCIRIRWGCPRAD
jgi:hypothetical protein